ncbi:Fis family transcriptional regulator [Helicobacter monodelphidis]|uniref:YifB family Mg chelatase-like AAA ATPase n=1 Tax=Helicobacter sp. 15-1451 TaxID=2004995 RepID=UPI000DCDE755|nr:YifB family Mg chelatase-like AAA ATPase [Helicobacter sp. 15-1451]RAX57015.1 Fis family transcriptional regulator [Helicobacter sp. 15-1451]
MGLQKIQSATLQGFEAKIALVEVAFVRGLPAFNITGLAHQSVQEAKHRSSSALAAIGFQFPPLKININLAPSDLPKQGSHFDLPIALLIGLHNRDIPPFLQLPYFALGELGLDGKVKATENSYSILLSLGASAYDGYLFVPKEQIDIYRKIPNLKLIPIDHLQEALDFFTTTTLPSFSTKEEHFDFPYLEEYEELYYYNTDFKEDFYDVIGQQNAKRAALIAASGFHNILFEGSPGCGKSMIAKRMRYILPPLSKQEVLKNAKMELYSTGKMNYSVLRPFRSPHASSSRAAILGSAIGHELKPGEIALSSGGILFLDELPHFPLQVLESLREPLETHRFSLSRAQVKVECEAAFLMVCAQNPCPCGNLMSNTHECRCSDIAIKNYKNRLSEPFLDRIDLYVPMLEDNSQHRTKSKELFSQVLTAFKAQKNRKQEHLNGHLNEEEIEKYCVLDAECQNLLTQATERFNLSYRSITKIKKVARTIADIQQSTNIQKSHLLEALSYRRRD